MAITSVASKIAIQSAGALSDQPRYSPNPSTFTVVSASWDVLLLTSILRTCVRTGTVVPGACLTTCANILEELPERVRLFDLWARHTAILRTMESEVIVQAFLYPSSAQHWHVELKKQAHKHSVRSKHSLPGRLTVQLKLTPFVTGFVASSHLQFVIWHRAAFLMPSKTNFSCTGHSVPMR